MHLKCHSNNVIRIELNTTALQYGNQTATETQQLKQKSRITPLKDKNLCNYVVRTTQSASSKRETSVFR